MVEKLCSGDFFLRLQIVFKFVTSEFCAEFFTSSDFFSGSQGTKIFQSLVKKSYFKFEKLAIEKLSKAQILLQLF